MGRPRYCHSQPGHPSAFRASPLISMMPVKWPERALLVQPYGTDQRRPCWDFCRALRREGRVELMPAEWLSASSAALKIVRASMKQRQSFGTEPLPRPLRHPRASVPDHTARLSLLISRVSLSGKLIFARMGEYE